ncbi:hypothetical protein [Cupriavidus sp. 8B]
MRIFSLFDAQMRGEILAGGTASQLRVGLQVRVVPEAAGLGSSGDYIFLPQGAMQSGIVTTRAEWWACLCGTIKLTPLGGEPVLVSAGGVYALRQAERLHLAVLQDTVLIRAILDPNAVGLVGAGATSSYDAFAVGQADLWQADGPERGAHGVPRANAAFVSLAEGEPEWALRLRAGGLNWAACHAGTLCLQWHSPWPHVERQVAYLQPGMVFAPDPDEAYRIDALYPVASLLCCLQAPARVAGAGEWQAISLH